MTQAADHLLVALGVVLDEGRILLTRRCEPEVTELHDRWELPGGKVEIGESPEMAAAREIREETGIEVTPVCLTPGSRQTMIRNSAGMKFTTLLGVICATQHAAKPYPPRDDAKVADAAWIRLDKLRFLDMLPESRELMAQTVCTLAEEPALAEQHGVTLAPSAGRGLYHLSLAFEPCADLPYAVERRWGPRARERDVARFDRDADARHMFLTHLKRRLDRGWEIERLDEALTQRILPHELSIEAIHSDQLRLFDTPQR